MRAQRIAKLEEEREVLEGSYRDALTAALRECARGRWGLFKQNVGLLPASLEQRYIPASVARLEEIADELRAVRAQLGYVEDSELMRRLAEYRAERGSNSLGEEKLAVRFLEELKMPST